MAASSLPSCSATFAGSLSMPESPAQHPLPVRPLRFLPEATSAPTHSRYAPTLSVELTRLNSRVHREVSGVFISTQTSTLTMHLPEATNDRGPFLAPRGDINTSHMLASEA